ncbi:MAG: hypothetical protein AAF639_06045, partial [Chloroflexota bacterium]
MKQFIRVLIIVVVLMLSLVLVPLAASTAQGSSETAISDASMIAKQNQQTVPTSPLPTPTITPTSEPTITPTSEPTATSTSEPTVTPTSEPTATPTSEPTATPTSEPTVTPTSEPTATATSEPTATATSEPTATATSEPTATATSEPTVTPLPTNTDTPTVTSTPTLAVINTATNTPVATPTAVLTETPTETVMPTGTSTVLSTTTPTSTVIAETPTTTLVPITSEPVTVTATLVVSETVSPSLTPTPTDTSEPTPTPSATATDDVFEEITPTAVSDEVGTTGGTQFMRPTATPATAPAVTPTPASANTGTGLFSFFRLPAETSTPITRVASTSLRVGTIAAAHLIGDRFRETVYAYGENGWLYQSTDSAREWKLVNTTPPVRDFVVSPFNPNVLYSGAGTPCPVAGDAIDIATDIAPPMYKSLDGGGNWIELPAGRGMRILLAHPADTEIVLAADCEDLYLSVDGGGTWMPRPDNSPLALWDNHYVVDIAVAPFVGDPTPTVPNWDFLYVAGTSNTNSGSVVALTNNIGSDWRRITPGREPMPRGVKAITTDPFGVGRLWIADGDGVWFTSNAGTTWEFSSLGLREVIGGGFQGPDFGLNDLVYHPNGNVYLATARGLYVKDALETRWEKITGTDFDQAR